MQSSHEGTLETTGRDLRGELQAPTAQGWLGDDAVLHQVREALRAARQQVDGAVAVLRERGAMNMDAAEAFARARGLCRRAERRLRSATGALRPGGADAAPLDS